VKISIISSAMTVKPVVAMTTRPTKRGAGFFLSRRMPKVAASANAMAKAMGHGVMPRIASMVSLIASAAPRSVAEVLFQINSR